MIKSKMLKKGRLIFFMFFLIRLYTNYFDLLRLAKIVFGKNKGAVYMQVEIHANTYGK